MEPVQTPRVFSNRYELTHLIARGGMAQVYRARDRLLDRPVALKVLFPELSVDRAFVERFRREAQAAANLSHPNIVPVFDWGEDAGTYFIVMEFVDGQPLSALLRNRGSLPPERIADIGAHVAAALAYAHRHGVIHRDVKPGNVLITDDGQVKVTDFGIARAVNTEESLTQTGAVMGTATYFSPEQAEGMGVDSRSDIYSLGVVLFEMVAGRPPFLGDTPVAVASKHVRDLAPVLSELNPGVPPALEAVIAKAMAKSPDDRYLTADELRTDLLRFAEGRPVSAGDPAATRMQQAIGTTGVMGAVGVTQAVPATAALAVAERDPEDEGRQTRTRRLVIALVVLLVALAVIAFFLLRSLGYLGGGSGTFPMPNVVHQPVATATSTLTAKGLTIGATNERSSTTERSGLVLSTNPPPGKTVKKGASVTLVVSSGAPQVAKVAVPNVVGQTFTAAVAALQTKGFGATEKHQASNKPNGTVLKQTPPVGALRKKGSTVVLTVSAQNTVTVPSVVGSSQTQAGATLANAGLTVGNTSSQCSNSYGNGFVASQSPASGAQVAPKTPVNLVLSSGACQAVVPNVVGQPQTAAKATLSGKGFSKVATTTTANCDPSQNGNVVSQNPTGGSSATTTSTVTLTVCNNTAPATTTTTVPATTTTTTIPSTTTTTTG